MEVVEGVGELDRDAWDGLLASDPDAPPFLEHRFLWSLEEAGVLGAENGWIPRFPVVKRNGRVIAAAPTYVKLHSQGEFVFDFAWAEFAQRLGETYYPKLLVGVPFTPVTGPRFLVAPGEDRAVLMRALGGVLVELAEAMGCSSVHVNFARPDEVEALAELGYHTRYGVQYHWHRHGEASFEDYLARFNSKRRNQLRRERREPEAQCVRLETLPGSALDPDLVKTAFRIYKSTVDKFYWGRQYLNQRVFELWAEHLGDRLELVVARDAVERVVAGAVNFRKGSRLYGRYWGCFEELKHLHFNVCYYHAIEECFQRGLDVFEPGAGGEHKLTRGFEPILMQSAHWIKSPRLGAAVERHLAMERREVERTQEAMLDSMGRKQS